MAVSRSEKAANKRVDTHLRTKGPISEGANQREVKTVERNLKLAGFDPGVVDNKFTAKTTTALRGFQKSVGLPETGQLDEATFKQLKGVQARVRNHDGWIGKGQAGDRVLEAEKRLKRLGYDPGAVDGVFDGDTAKAVAAFKKDQPRDLKGNHQEILGTRGQQVLERETKALSHDPYRGRTKPSAEHRRLDSLTTTRAARTNLDGTTGFGVGENGRHVKNVQLKLRAAGYDPKHTDGKFDERTEGALKAFQRRSKLPVTGRVDEATWNKLGKAEIYSTKAGAPAQREGERSRAVLRSERLLKQLGYSVGKVDGLFTKQTERAVKSFERKNHLKADGAIQSSQIRKMEKELDRRTVSPRELRAIMPNLPASTARRYAPLLNTAMREQGITSPRRQAHFVAQLAHESIGLTTFEELGDRSYFTRMYEGRSDLGNTRPGDGARYHGRGPIQLTGRANYRRYGQLLGLPLERKPWLAARPSVGFRIASLFWRTHGLNAKADRNDFYGITTSINGGTNGYSDRYQYWQRARRVLA
ncbi:MAG: peptidoglycan-binding protein [Myxococcota bacterium]